MFWTLWTVEIECAIRAHKLHLNSSIFIVLSDDVFKKRRDQPSAGDQPPFGDQPPSGDQTTNGDPIPVPEASDDAMSVSSVASGVSASSRRAQKRGASPAEAAPAKK